MIIGGTVLGVFVLGFLTILTIGVVNRAINGTEIDGNVITSAHFEVTVPEGTTLSKSSDELSNSIYAVTPTEYGELRTSIHRSSLDIQTLRESGEITKSEITVDGTPATLKLIDFSRTISGRSEKLLIRYRVEVEKISQPSAEEYTNVEVTAMSKRNLTVSEQKDVQEKARAIIDSLVIK